MGRAPSLVKWLCDGLVPAPAAIYPLVALTGENRQGTSPDYL
ncbi:hypothetical protein NSND_62953 [Nitrospira sp. ND1]|nr:hypothetical protein NSND_62953 [Nitrospira sp. ND1]